MHVMAPSHELAVCSRMQSGPDMRTYDDLGAVDAARLQVVDQHPGGVGHVRVPGGSRPLRVCLAA